MGSAQDDAGDAHAALPREWLLSQSLHDKSLEASGRGNDASTSHLQPALATLIGREVAVRWPDMEARVIEAVKVAIEQAVRGTATAAGEASEAFGEGEGARGAAAAEEVHVRRPDAEEERSQGVDPSSHGARSGAAGAASDGGLAANDNDGVS